MPTSVLTVFTNVTSPENDAAYNDWYDNVHLKDVFQVPGFVAATRYRLSTAQAKGVEVTGQSQYLAIYEVETDDLQGALDTLMAAGRGMVFSEHLDRKNLTAFLYEEIAPRVTGGAPA
jgi:hypothetical protein